MKVKKFADEIYVLFGISNNDARLIFRAYIHILLLSPFKYFKLFLYFLFYIKISITMIIKT